MDLLVFFVDNQPHAITGTVEEMRKSVVRGQNWMDNSDFDVLLKNGEFDIHKGHYNYEFKLKKFKEV